MLRSILFAAVVTIAPVIALAETVQVTAENFIRAETDHYMAKYAAQGGLGRLLHTRLPVPVERQDVIRMNRDTIYSGGVFDLSSPLTITLPESDGRFQSMQVVNQDHYTVAVEHEPGAYEFTEERAGTRYVAVLIRTFMDPNDPDDVARANELQDGIEVSQGSVGEFEVPDWDLPSLATVRGLVLALAATASGDFEHAFGARGKVSPIMHFLGTASGWGGNPREAAMYFGAFPEKNDGQVPHSLTVRDVPVDGFWSVTVYNEDGFMEKNARDVYSYNGVTAQRNADGSVTLHFGGCEEGVVNCIPITDGWNYVVRLYRPRAEILEGRWQFPRPEPLR